MSEHLVLCYCVNTDKAVLLGTKGLNTLKETIVPSDGFHAQLLDVVGSVGVHENCRRSYLNTRRVSAIAESCIEVTDTEPPKLRSALSNFIFKRHCLFCGELASISVDLKNLRIVVVMYTKLLQCRLKTPCVSFL